MKRGVCVVAVLALAACSSSSASTRRPAKVLIVGTSITMVALPDMGLVFAGRRVIPRVGPGSTVAYALPKLRRLLAQHPDAVIVELGADDALAGRADWVPQFDRLVRALDGARCVVMTNLSASLDYYGSRISHRASTFAVAWDRRLAREVGARGWQLVDWARAVESDRTLVRSDGYHPSPSGAIWLAVHWKAAVGRC